MKTPASRFDKNIKRIREQKNMTQGVICRATGSERAQARNIETDKGLPVRRPQTGNPALATIKKSRPVANAKCYTIDAVQTTRVTNNELLR